MIFINSNEMPKFILTRRNFIKNTEQINKLLIIRFGLSPEFLLFDVEKKCNFKQKIIIYLTSFVSKKYWVTFIPTHTHRVRDPIACFGF